jgi:hypothetical protein
MSENSFPTTVLRKLSEVMAFPKSPSSESIIRQAKSIVAAQPHFRGTAYPLQFHAYDRVLVITGRVPSFYLKQLLQSTLTNINGIDRIVNEIEVDYHRFGS